MADEKRNEILEEQRRARQEFLELKKIQHGEKAAPPKPSEVAIVPTTPKEKWDDFWFQYKWYAIVITAMAVVLAVLIAQCATRKSYDLKVVYFAYTAAIDEQTSPISSYLEKYAYDINGDGEVNVQVVNCSFNDKDGNTQYKYTVMTKLQAMIAGDTEAMLFITDDSGYEYLNNLSDGENFLEAEPTVFGEDFYNAVRQENLKELPEGLAISCRRVNNTVFEDKKDVEKLYNGAKEVLKNLEKSIK